MKKYVFLFIGILTVCFVHANDALTYLEQMRSNYMDLKSFAIELKYTLYEGYQSNTVAESYPSHFYGEGKNVYRRMNEMEIVVKDDKMITLDQSSRTIILSDPQDVSFQEVNFDEALKNCSDLSVGTRGANYLVHLDFKSNQGNPYSKIDVELDDEFLIKKVTLFFAQKVNFSKTYGEQRMEFPRLEIEYTTFSKRWKDSEGLINMQNYIVATEEGFKVAEHYKNYELIDLRLTNQN